MKAKVEGNSQLTDVKVLLMNIPSLEMTAAVRLAIGEEEWPYFLASLELELYREIEFRYVIVKNSIANGEINLVCQTDIADLLTVRRKMTAVTPRMSVSDRYDEDIEINRPPYAKPLLVIDALRKEIGEESWPTHPQNPLWGEELYTNPYMTDVELGMRVAARKRRDREASVEVAAGEGDEENALEREWAVIETRRC